MNSFASTVVALALTASSLAAQDDPAALVVRVNGDVSIRQGAGASTGAASVGQRLMVGDEVVPAAGAGAILLTPTGASLTVREATMVTAPAGGGNPDMFQKAMRTFARAASADARSTSGRQGMIRPVPGGISALAPRNGLTITSHRPTFSWSAMEGAEGYLVQIRPVDGGTPMRFSTGAVTEWTLPDEQAALLPGTEYAWTVAPAGGRPATEQRFRIIDADTYTTLQADLEQIGAMGLDPDGDGRLLAALVYRDLELYYDAHAALSEVAAEGSPGPDVYLLDGEVLNWLGRGDDARQAFDRADGMMR